MLPAEIADTRTPIVAVTPSGSGKPFFFLHGDWFRDASFCFPLAKNLGIEHPLYISHPYAISDLRSLPTIETMAAEHIKSIRSVQPRGPYLLGGFCNGALLAHEMALQLHTQEETVDLLVMIDPMEPIPRPTFKLTYDTIHRLGTLLRADDRQRLDWFLVLCNFQRYVKHRFRRTRRGHRKPVAHSLALWPSMQELRNNYDNTLNWILGEYRPRTVYSGKIAVLWASEEPLHSFRRMVWAEMMREKNEGDITIQIIAGSHTTCKTEYLPDMARHLDACLRSVHSSS